MSPLSEADQYLLQRIRSGDAEGWSQLVDRFQGRLLAFARNQVSNPADAEDLVQETFISFLKGLKRFRAEAGLETYLFTILRRRIVDWLRGRRLSVCQLRDSLGGGEEHEDRPAVRRIASSEPTASWYARREEALEAHDEALAGALADVVADLKSGDHLEALRIVEALFYGQLRNKQVAQVVGVSEQRVGQVKFRMLQRIRELAAQRLGAGSSDGLVATEALWSATGGSPVIGMLTDAWERQRLTCPKRSTLGRRLLGTLDPPWSEHVRFHVERLGCRYCRANLDDLERRSRVEPRRDFQDRILKSTVGFLKKA